MSQKKFFRLWPSAVIALLVASYVVPLLLPQAFLFGLLGGLLGVAAVLVWWLFFSGAPWLERVGAVILMAIARRRDEALPSCVHRDGGHGKPVLHFRDSAPGLAFAGVGGCHSSPLGRSAVGIDDRDHPPRVRVLDAPSDGRR